MSGIFSKPKAPAPPDPAALAAAQGKANIEAIQESARQNQINQVGPYGSVSYSGDIGSPDRTQTVTLAPEQQAQLGARNKLAMSLLGYGADTFGGGQPGMMFAGGSPTFNERTGERVGSQSGGMMFAGGTPGFNERTGEYTGQAPDQMANRIAAQGGGLPELASRVDTSGLPNLNQDYSQDASRVEQATYDKLTGLMNPDIERDRRRLATSLITTGNPLGSEGYRDESTRFETGVNEARTRAALDAVGAGRAEQSRLFDIASRARGQGVGEQFGMAELANRARGQEFGENLALSEEGRAGRAEPINALSAILSGNQVQAPNAPDLAQYQVAPADIMGATQMGYQGAMNTYNQRMAQQNAALGGLSQLGAAAIFACWVAEVLYGISSDTTRTIRAFVKKHMNDPTTLGKFCRAYLKYGKKWAESVKKDHAVRDIAKPMWDRFYLCAVMENG